MAKSIICFDRNFKTSNKNDLLARKMELIESNQSYALIKDTKRITSTVTTKNWPYVAGDKRHREIQNNADS